MKFTRSLLASFAASLLLLAVGCKDTPVDQDNPSADRKALLVRSWKTQSVTANGADMKQQYANVTTFKADGTYMATYPSSNPDNGTWKLSADNAKLLMDEGTSTAATWDILELTSSKLHMKATIMLGQPLQIDFVGVPQ